MFILSLSCIFRDRLIVWNARPQRLYQDQSRTKSPEKKEKTSHEKADVCKEGKRDCPAGENTNRMKHKQQPPVISGKHDTVRGASCNVWEKKNVYVRVVGGGGEQGVSENGYWWTGEGGEVSSYAPKSNFG